MKIGSYIIVIGIPLRSGADFIKSRLEHQVTLFVIIRTCTCGWMGAACDFVTAQDLDIIRVCCCGLVCVRALLMKLRCKRSDISMHMRLC